LVLMAVETKVTGQAFKSEDDAFHEEKQQMNARTPKLIKLGLNH
jgi:hypothetical protein